MHDSGLACRLGSIIEANGTGSELILSDFVGPSHSRRFKIAGAWLLNTVKIGRKIRSIRCLPSGKNTLNTVTGKPIWRANLGISFD